MRSLLTAVLLTGMAMAQCAMPTSSSTGKNKQEQKMSCCGGGGGCGGGSAKAVDNKSTTNPNDISNATNATAESYGSCGKSASADGASGGGCGGGEAAGSAMMCSRKANKSQKPKTDTAAPSTKKK